MATKKVRPNYKCTKRVSGWDLSDYGKESYGKETNPWEWPRWFDNKKRVRKVFITITKVYGDYHHWYASLKEEANPFWIRSSEDMPGGAWGEDERARGQKFEEKFNTEDGAKAYADIIMRDHFPKHRPIKGDKYSAQKTWHYSREGD